MQVEEASDYHRLVANLNRSMEGPIVRFAVAKKHDSKLAKVWICWRFTDTKFSGPNPDVESLESHVG